MHLVDCARRVRNSWKPVKGRVSAICIRKELCNCALARDDSLKLSLKSEQDSLRFVGIVRCCTLADLIIQVLSR